MMRNLDYNTDENLENQTDYTPEKIGKMKRVKLPIPKEYGGGIVTGYGYEEAVRNLISRIGDKIRQEYKAPDFRESWKKWIEIKSGQKRSESTISSYKWIAETYLLPFFGEKRMDEITADDIQKFFNSIMHLSRSISTQCKAILSGIFDRAVRLGDIQRNIMLYKYERSKKQGTKVVLQDDDLIGVISQMDKLLETGDIRDYLYFCFLCFTALRRGEILGLRWSDLDLAESRLSVRNNVTFPNGQNDPVICAPKDDSFGVVHLQSELVCRIRKYVGIGNRYILPFSQEEPDKPMTKSMFIKMWRRITSVIDLKGATSHSFRASYATMLNAHCDHVDPKVLQGVLRHKTPDLAIKIYTKENAEKTKKAEKEYDEYLCSALAHKKAY